MGNRISLIRENCFRETVQITRSAKIVCLENLALYGKLTPVILFSGPALAGLALSLTRNTQCAQENASRSIHMIQPAPSTTADVSKYQV